MTPLSAPKFGFVSTRLASVFKVVGVETFSLGTSFANEDAEPLDSGPVPVRRGLKADTIVPKLLG